MGFILMFADLDPLLISGFGTAGCRRVFPAVWSVSVEPPGGVFRRAIGVYSVVPSGVFSVGPSRLYSVVLSGVYSVLLFGVYSVLDSRLCFGVGFLTLVWCFVF